MEPKLDTVVRLCLENWRGGDDTLLAKAYIEAASGPNPDRDKEVVIVFAVAHRIKTFPKETPDRVKGWLIRLAKQYKTN